MGDVSEQHADVREAHAGSLVAALLGAEAGPAGDRRY